MKTNEIQKTEKVGCGSSWIGFWKRGNRQVAWENVAMSAASNWHGYSQCNWMDASKTLNRLLKLEFWAMHRASRYHWDDNKRANRKTIKELFSHINQLIELSN